MTNAKFKMSRLALLTGLAFSAMLAAPTMNSVSPLGFDVVAQAQAEEDGGGGKGKGAKGGAGMGQGGSTGDHGQVKGKGKRDVMMKGQGGPGEDSDRPDWAGVKGGKAGAGGKPGSAGTKRGDLFGDLYVLIRNPVTGVADTETIGGKDYPVVQAYTKDAAGNLIPLPGVSIPRDAEGNLLPTLANGTAVFPSEVEFSRLNVARAPSKVFDRQLTDAVKTLSSGTIGLDATGRLTVTTSTGTTTIDSPLTNLAIYQALLTAGTLTGGTLTAGGITVALPSNYLAASALAAATDKSKTVTLDTVMYMSSFLKVTPTLSSVSYDRAATWSAVSVQVLVQTSPGIYEVKTVNVYDAVFGGIADGVAAGATDYATMVNDTVRVIQFVHDNEVR